MQPRRVVVDLQLEQAFYRMHAAGQILLPGLLLVLVGDEKQCTDRNYQQQAKRDENRPLDLVALSNHLAGYASWWWIKRQGSLPKWLRNSGSWLVATPGTPDVAAFLAMPKIKPPMIVAPERGMPGNIVDDWANPTIFGKKKS